LIIRLTEPKLKVIRKMKNKWQLISSFSSKFNLVLGEQKEKISSQLFWNLLINKFIERIPNSKHKSSDQFYQLTEKGINYGKSKTT